MPAVGPADVSQVVRRRGPAPGAPAEYSRRSGGDSAIDDRSRWAQGRVPGNALRKRGAGRGPRPFGPFTGSARRAARVAITEPPPVMSRFIETMPSRGLIDRPPVS